MNYNAVLFDFDGVIAYTMDYHVQAWIEAFSKYQMKVKADDIYYQEGQIADTIARILAQKYGLNLTETELDQITLNKREIYKRITKAKIYPEIMALLEKLKTRSMLLGIVTGSVIPNMVVVTGEAFLKNFDVIITADSVTKNKPFPDPYLAAADKLGINPVECIVFENAPMGIQAAKAAGMFCVAVKTTIKDEKYLAEADSILEDVSKFPIELLIGEDR